MRRFPIDARQRAVRLVVAHQAIDPVDLVERGFESAEACGRRRHRDHTPGSCTIDIRHVDMRAGFMRQRCWPPAAGAKRAARRDNEAQALIAASANGHCCTRHDQMREHENAGQQLSSRTRMTFTSVVAKTKIQPASATRLGSGYSHMRYVPRAHGVAPAQKRKRADLADELHQDPRRDQRIDDQP